MTRRLPGSGGEEEAPAWGPWFRHIDVELGSGAALMAGHDGRPLLVLDRIGDGRVAQLLSDQSWLWSRGYRGGGPQSDLLRRLVHWLMKEPDLEEETLVAEVAGGRIEVVRRSLDAISGPVAVTAPDGERGTLALSDGGAGRASAELSADAPGLYRFEHDGHSAIAVVGVAQGEELGDMRATAEILGPLAEATGGGVRWIAGERLPDIRRVRAGRALAGRGWIGLADRRGSVVTGLEQTPLMPRLALRSPRPRRPPPRLARREPLSVYPRSAARRRRAMTVAWISAAPSKMLSMRASTSTRLIGYSSA